MEDAYTQQQSPRVVVVGELNVDLILEQVNALPELDKERIAGGMTLTLGSSSAILASNAGALGLDVGFIGRVGTDAFGDFVVEQLRARRVDTRYVIETPETATGLTAIYTYESRRGAVTYPGAMTRLTINDMPWDYIEHAQHLHLSSYYLQTGLRPDCAALFRRAKAQGLTTSFDTNWDPDDAWGDDVLEVLDSVDVFLPNDDEARLISGEQNLDRAMAVLAERAGAVVVTCGAEGVRARKGRDVFSLPAFPVEPVDAIGAGDSFNAGFLYRFVEGDRFEDCLYYGRATGAFSTQAAGGTAAFEDAHRVRHFLEAHPLT